MSESLYSNFFNKEAVARNMTAQHGFDSTMQTLLKFLSIKEMRILYKHKDLISKVYDITKLTDDEMLQILQDRFSLKPDNWEVGDEVWMSTEKLEKRIPSWYSNSHIGWAISRENGDFSRWARRFLLREIQVNIWIRYVEYKRKESKQYLNFDASHMGLYLG